MMRTSRSAVALASVWLAALVACGGGNHGGSEYNEGIGTGGTGGSGNGGNEPTGGSGGDDGTGGNEPTGGTGGNETGGTGGDGPGGCPVVPPIEDAQFAERYDTGADVVGFVSKPNLSGGNADIVWYEFWTLEVGHFEFGPGTNNVRLGECDQCFTLALDVDEALIGKKEFFPESGSVDVTATTITYGSGTAWETVTVKHNDVVFREYDWETNSVVADGACFTMQQVVLFE